MLTPQQGTSECPLEGDRTAGCAALVAQSPTDHEGPRSVVISQRPEGKGKQMDSGLEVSIIRGLLGKRLAGCQRLCWCHLSAA